MDRSDKIVTVLFKKDKVTLEEAKLHMEMLPYVKLIETTRHYVFARELPENTEGFYYTVVNHDKLDMCIFKKVPRDWYLPE